MAVEVKIKKPENTKEIMLLSDDYWSPLKIDYSQKSGIVLKKKANLVKLNEGIVEKKPWDYKCECWIPIMDTVDTIQYVIELLSLQTITPYIVLVDTGSTRKNFRKLEEIVSSKENIELHSIRMRATRHSSDYPAVAMDLAMSMCRTDYLFCTHADVFPKTRFLLEKLIGLCDEVSPAVGYRMTEREHADWNRMVSHTATMLHIPTMDKVGASWSLRRLCNRKGMEFIANNPKMGNNWPDTEILYNYMLWESGYKGLFIGEEKNHEMTDDNYIIHARSLTAGRLYAPNYAEKANEWAAYAIKESEKRIVQWTNNQTTIN